MTLAVSPKAWPTDWKDEVKFAQDKLPQQRATEVNFLYSAGVGDEEQVQTLIDQGVNLEARTDQQMNDSWGVPMLFPSNVLRDTALHLAVRHKNPSIVSTLLHNAMLQNKQIIDAENTRGETALFLAAEAEDPSPFLTLVENGASLTNTSKVDLSTRLFKTLFESTIPKTMAVFTRESADFLKKLSATLSLPSDLKPIVIQYIGFHCPPIACSFALNLSKKILTEAEKKYSSKLTELFTNAGAVKHE